MPSLWKLGLLIFFITSAAQVNAAEREFPLWDGRETLEAYAEHVKLPPRLTVLCGPEKMELVLIPAGRFTMGTPAPAKPRSTVFYGQVIEAAGCAIFLAIVLSAIIHASHRRARFQFSLASFIGLALSAGIVLTGGIYAQQTEYALEKYKRDCELRQSDEEPAHEVTITQPFYIGECEVTQAQFRTLLPIFSLRFDGDKLPVELVSWEDANLFCDKLSEAARVNARLPTEAEWEFACRAGSSTRFCFGDSEEELEEYAWYEKSSQRRPHEAGSKKPNAFALYDMHGNVAEWCSDSYDGGYYLKSAKFNPKGPRDESNWHSMRGGDYREESSKSRSSFRAGSNNKCGLRVVVSIIPKAR